MVRHQVIAFNRQRKNKEEVHTIVNKFKTPNGYVFFVRQKQNGETIFSQKLDKENKAYRLFKELTEDDGNSKSMGTSV